VLFFMLLRKNCIHRVVNMINIESYSCFVVKLILRGKYKLKLNSVALVRERTMPTERPPLVGEVVPTFADIGCHVVSATDSHGR
jgi:hypothetical protein